MSHALATVLSFISLAGGTNLSGDSSATPPSYIPPPTQLASDNWSVKGPSGSWRIRAVVDPPPQSSGQPARLVVTYGGERRSTRHVLARALSNVVLSDLAIVQQPNSMTLVLDTSPGGFRDEVLLLRCTERRCLPPRKIDSPRDSRRSGPVWGTRHIRPAGVRGTLILWPRNGDTGWALLSDDGRIRQRGRTGPGNYVSEAEADSKGNVLLTLGDDRHIELLRWTSGGGIVQRVTVAKGDSVWVKDLKVGLKDEVALHLTVGDAAAQLQRIATGNASAIDQLCNHDAGNAYYGYSALAVGRDGTISLAYVDATESGQEAQQPSGQARPVRLYTATGGPGSCSGTTTTIGETHADFSEAYGSNDMIWIGGRNSRGQLLFTWATANGRTDPDIPALDAPTATYAVPGD